jgi:hypothetical protein
MAQPTRNLGMVTSQLEFYRGVIEIMAKAVHAVMAGKAIYAKIQDVGLSKVCINLSVTSAAIALVIIGVALGMAIDATEWRSIAFILVCGQ